MKTLQSHVKYIVTFTFHSYASKAVCVLRMIDLLLVKELLNGRLEKVKRQRSVTRLIFRDAKMN